jgi:hypothetical protein
MLGSFAPMLESFARAVAVLVAIGCGTAAAQVTPGALHGVLGANKFDLAKQYEGTASNGDGSSAYLAVTKAMGLKSIADAANNGFAFLRVSAAGYGPVTATQIDIQGANDLWLWMNDPAQYWSRLDAMYNDLDAHKMRLVPSFVWNPFQFPALAGETLATMVANPSSKSRHLLTKYITQFIARYKSRKTILFYELTNELNLEADIDIVGLCLADRGADNCTAYGNFTTAQMNEFAASLVATIRKLDPARQIGSGYALPRPAAYHLMGQPGFSLNGPDWTPDTPSQFRSLIATTHAPFDLVSAHIYPGDVRWGNAAGTEYLTLDGVAAAASASGKNMYLGEFSDTSNSPFIATMLQRLVTDRVAYSSVWVWEFYQNSTWQSTDVSFKAGSSLEPGFTDALDAALLAAAGTGAWHDPGNPRVVITSPLPCATVGGTIDIYAVASASQPITKMQLTVDGNFVGYGTAPPFHVSYQITGTGQHRIGASGAASGIRTSATETVVFGSSPHACVVK